MAEEKVRIQLKVVAQLGERKFEHNVNHVGGIHLTEHYTIYEWDIDEALKRYVLRNCDDEEILKEIAKSMYEKRMLVFNPNLSHEMADNLVDELYTTDEFGLYLYEFGVLLRNPCVSGKKLDSLANNFLKQYADTLKAEGRPDFELQYLLQNIARNLAVWESTLETLKRSGIPTVVNSAQR